MQSSSNPAPQRPPGRPRAAAAIPAIAHLARPATVARLTALIALAALAALAAIVAGVAAAPALALPIQVTPPALDVQQHQLPNGLQVLLLEDHSVPVATVEVWYHVGSKNERRGRTGFAHLFEHLMFKGSAHIGAEEHSHFIESIGGRDNATTDWDRTLYFETIPSNYLDRILWMEADRMQTLDVSEDNFRSEREVVKEERRQNTDNRPFGHLAEIVFGNAYTTHPYHSLPIGSMVDLDAATIGDVRDFYRTYYVPNNATLVIAGDFDPARALHQVEAYFGPIPQGAPIDRAAPPEPAQTAPRRTVVYDSTAPLPAVILAYHGPAARSADVYALEIASHILSGGESSRIYRKLVYERQIAVDAAGQPVTLEDPGLFFFYAILQQNQKPEAGVGALQEEIDRLVAQPVSAAELETARNQVVAGRVFGRERSQDKADAIGYASVILGDLSRVNHDLQRYEQVTAADVQRVARTYFMPQNCTTVLMLPEAMRPPGAAGDAKDGGAHP